MKTTILSLVLASIAGLMYCGDESLAGFARRSQQCRTCCPVIIERKAETPPAVQDPEDPELRALLEARRDTLKEVVTFLDGRFQIGTMTADELLLAETALMEAELELVKSQQERIAIFEKMLAVQTEVERLLSDIVASGGRRGVDREVARGVGPQDLLIAKAARMKVEIDLHKARKKAK